MYGLQCFWALDDGAAEGSIQDGELTTAPQVATSH